MTTITAGLTTTTLMMNLTMTTTLADTAGLTTTLTMNLTMVNRLADAAEEEEETECSN